MQIIFNWKEEWKRIKLTFKVSNRLCNGRIQIQAKKCISYLLSRVTFEILAQNIVFNVHDKRLLDSCWKCYKLLFATTIAKVSAINLIFALRPNIFRKTVIKRACERNRLSCWTPIRNDSYRFRFIPNNLLWCSEQIKLQLISISDATKRIPTDLHNPLANPHLPKRSCLIHVIQCQTR